ncbi:MAG: aldo/keto reductase [Proteobacteria bacterium]|nr:aldo/keto reductase [Pseudomonadota bacterium]
MSIPRLPFGNTGHLSSRTLFGAAALGGMKQDRADQTLEMLDRFGLNHIDTAASYGDSELRLAPFLKHRRKDFFVASKTGERSGSKARAQLEASLTRLGIDQLDLIQLHNLVADQDWQTAFADDGAVAALARAQEEGLVRYLGVTGHGTTVAAAHQRSLQAFPFDSVLLPYSFAMNRQADYHADFEELYKTCVDRQVAIQTIKSVALRRWNEGDPDKRYSWYKPLRDQAAIKRAVDFTLSRDHLFLNTSSDATILPLILKAADAPIDQPDDQAMKDDVETYGIEPLFVRGVSDQI